MDSKFYHEIIAKNSLRCDTVLLYGSQEMLTDVIKVSGCLQVTFKWFRKRCMSVCVVCMCVSLHVSVFVCEGMCEFNSVREREQMIASEMKF